MIEQAKWSNSTMGVALKMCFQFTNCYCSLGVKWAELLNCRTVAETRWRFVGAYKFCHLWIGDSKSSGCRSGMGLSPLVLHPKVGLLYQLQIMLHVEHWWQGKREVPGLNPCSCCALSNTNSMWMTLISNLGLLSEKPATNHLSYCMAVKISRGLKF
jgi:hypothetical protein